MDIKELYRVKMSKKNVMDEFNELIEIGEELEVKSIIINMILTFQINFFSKSTNLENINLKHADEYNIYVFSCFMTAWNELDYNDEDEPDNKEDYYELVAFIIILLNGEKAII